jgi:hypothetical protein
MDAKIALENLVLARDALTQLKIPYFLADGTLLGLVRGGCFIDSDDDIDIGVLAEDFNILTFGLFASLMRRRGFFHRHFHGVWGKYFVAHWWRQDVVVDTGFYFRRGDQRITHGFDKSHIIEFSYPARLFEARSQVEFYGNTFMAPEDGTAVLSHQYGDWRVPRTDWEWKTSPPNITRRIRTTKWKMLQSRVSNRILGLSARVMGHLSSFRANEY